MSKEMLVALGRQTDPREGSDGSLDEPSALERLFDSEGTKCYSLAIELLGSPEAAAEVVGEVLGQAVRSGPGAQTPRALLSEVHRLAVRRIRGRASRPDPAGLDAHVWNRIENSHIPEVLSRLPMLARRTALLVYFAGYQIQELAQTLDLEPAEIRTALCTAMTALRRDPRTCGTP